MRAVARRPSDRLIEAAAVGAAGAVLGALALRPLRLSAAGALVGGANGALGGYLEVYDWRTRRGIAALALDSTWGIVGTAAGLALQAANQLQRDPGYLDELSRRANRYVYRRGWGPRPRFAFTAGNVVTGAGDVANEARRSLVAVHEDLHVWQNRWFGPLYPALYGAWMAGGAAAGAVAWARGREALFAAVEKRAYYFNPFERWAYTADGNWPPARLRRLSDGPRVG